MPKQIVPYLSGFFPLPLPLSLLLHYFPPFPGPHPSLIWVSNKTMYNLAIWMHSHPLTLFHRLHYIIVTPWKTIMKWTPPLITLDLLFCCYIAISAHISPLATSLSVQTTPDPFTVHGHSYALQHLYGHTDEVGLMATAVYILIQIRSLLSLKVELPNTPTAVPYPSWLHTIVASSRSQTPSHTVPHEPLIVVDLHALCPHVNKPFHLILNHISKHP